MWSLVALITFIHVFVDCIAREPNQGESSSRPQRHHWNPDIYRHDSLCCESQFSFKKQTPYVFKDSILLLLNPTLQYLNFHFLQSALDSSCTATTFYIKYPSTHYQAEQQCDPGFRGLQVWTRKKLGISSEIDLRILTREEQCRCVFQMVMEG